MPGTGLEGAQLTPNPPPPSPPLLTPPRTHTQTYTHLSRTFPAGTRVDSSNFLPQPMFNTGVQMCALNVQTDGLPLQQLMNRFRDNGRCGYLLKPGCLLNPELPFDPYLPKGYMIPGATPLHLEMTIISAQGLPRGKVIRPVITVDVVGVPCDMAARRSSTAPSVSARRVHVRAVCA